MTVSAARSSSLSAFGLATAQDVFALRRIGQSAAEALGMDRQDQVRIATALSELGRDRLGCGGLTVAFTLPEGPEPVLAVVFEWNGGTKAGPDLEPASRLLHRVRHESADARERIVAEHALPAGWADILVVARTRRNRPPVCVAVPAEAAGGTDERELLQQLVNACALALEALRTFNEEHALALALQRTFLPDRLPSLPGVSLAVRYLPASDHAEIGGDFYEALETPDGLLLAIGDVAGHSLVAATVMGEIRHALRAYALEGHPPHHVLERLDALLAHTRPGLTVTLCLVLVDPHGSRIHVANAGHIPPLLLAPDGTAAYLHEHGPLLGLRLPHPPARVHPVAPDTRILLITDGLVEVRTENLDDSLARFRSATLEGPWELEALCDALLGSFGEDKEDDIALLAIALGPGPEPAA
ncbi:MULTISPECIES: SpoIIE family protein phosphatase [unclassified Streptomyces]|uniref:PP2C family protein-serine/threonine phosphatase n=1 Tax=unclassified Streptomyces TaxID=2593676 RepID=UPI0027E530D3|nr:MULTISPECIES: SpoIIE family protein phosphatase [unclassified Streptomyces]